LGESEEVTKRGGRQTFSRPALLTQFLIQLNFEKMNEALVGKIIKVNTTELKGYSVRTYRLETIQKISDYQIQGACEHLLGETGTISILKRATARNDHGFFEYECEATKHE
jgi:tRNA G37 N-methylase TrmD